MTTTGEMFAIAEAAIEYEVARRVALLLKDERNILECEQVTAYEHAAFEAESDDPRFQTYEVPKPCWKREEWDSNREPSDPKRWCASCLKRQQLHRAHITAARARGAKFRTLQRAALKQIDLRTIEREVEKRMGDSEQRGHEGAVEDDATKQPESASSQTDGHADPPADETPKDATTE